MGKFGFWKTLFIILAVVVFILLFIILLGRVSPTKLSRTTEFKEDPETARKKNRRYRVLVESKKKLQVQLKKTFKRIYFGVRIGLVASWVGLLVALYFIGLITTPEDLLIYSQLALILIGIATFLTFGTITNLKTFIHNLEVKLENKVFGKYIDLKELPEIEEAKVIEEKEVSDV